MNIRAVRNILLEGGKKSELAEGENHISICNSPHMTSLVTPRPKCTEERLKKKKKNRI